MSLPLYTASATVGVKRGGRTYFRSASASSPLGEEDARNLARDEARRRATEVAQGRAPDERGEYPYAKRLLVEPVLERIALDGVELARITRNRYKASVLNAYQVMFVDVDMEADPLDIPGDNIVSREEALGALDALVEERNSLAFRVYETRAGLRYLCTSHLFDPLSSDSAQIMQRLKADKRYAALCRVQKCYRARLTPKPWRCVIPGKKGFFAWLFGEGARREPERFTTCRYMKHVGAASTMTPAIERIVETHDRISGAFRDLPLA